MSWGQGTGTRWHHGHKARGYPLCTPLFLRQQLLASHRKHHLGREGMVQGKERQDVLLGTPGRQELAPTQSELAEAEGGRPRSWRGERGGERGGE